MRVVSLLPSATEVLCAIGGASRLVGRSHECDYPPAIADRPILTAQKTTATGSAEIDRQVRDVLLARGEGESADRSLYTIDVDALRELRPDVILTQDLCEVCSIDLNTVRAVAASLNPAPQIVSLNPASIDDVFDDMLRVGDAVGLAETARDAMIELRERYWSIREYVNAYIEGPRVAFLEWMDPLFLGGHWTPQLIEQAGGRHVINPPGAKSRRIAAEDLVEAMPERLIICPCGYDIQTTMQEIDELRSQRWWPMLPAVQDDRVAVVDGNQMFNRPGPRLVDALAWLVGWLNDRAELIPDDFPWQPLATHHPLSPPGR